MAATSALDFYDLLIEVMVCLAGLLDKVRSLTNSIALSVAITYCFLS